MIFTIGDIIIMLLVVAALALYRQLDRNNRSLEKVKRFSDKVSKDLSELVDSKTVELRNLSIELDVHQKSAREALKRISGIEQEINHRTEGVDKIETRLSEYDRALNDLIEMTRAVDENLQRLHSESEFVDTVGKRLRESLQTMAQIEKNIPLIKQDFAAQNASQLKVVSAEVLNIVESQVDTITEQVSRSEAIVSDFSVFIESLEQKRDQMEQDTIGSLRSRLQGFVSDADEAKADLARQFGDDVNSLLEGHEANAQELIGTIELEHSRLASEVSGTQDVLAEKLEMFQDRMSNIEEGYHRTLREVADRGKSLEDEVFSRLKDHIENRAHTTEASLMNSLSESKNRLESSRNEIVEMFGDARSEVTVWRAELQKSTNESTHEIQERFSAFAREMEKTLQTSLEETSRNQLEQTERLDTFLLKTKTDIGTLEQRIDKRVESLRATIETKESDFAARIQEIERIEDSVVTNVRNDIDSRISDYRNELLNRFTSIESDVAEYESSISHRVSGVENVYTDIDSLGGRLTEYMDQVSDRIRSEFDAVLDEMHVEREKEKRNAEDQLSEIRDSMETVDRELQELKTRAYENVSEKLQIYEDGFFSDLDERGSKIEEQLQEWQAQLSNRLEDLSSEHRSARTDLERKYSEDLTTSLSDLQEQLTNRYEKYDAQVEGFENRTNLRLHDTESTLNSFETSIQEELNSVKNDTEAELSGEVTAIKNNVREQIESGQRDMQTQLRELSESFEGGKDSLMQVLESAQSDVTVWQAKVLQQIRQAETDVAGNIESLRSETHGTVEDLKETFRAQREDLVTSSEEERNRLHDELSGLRARVEELQEHLDTKSSETLTAVDHQSRTFLEEFGERSRVIQDEVEDRIRDFRTQVQDMRDKIDASQQKLYGSIEENYRILSVSVQEIEKKQKSFLSQTKLFERADTLKQNLQVNIDGMKADLTRIDEQAKEIKATEREFSRIRKLGSEVSAKLGKFSSEKRRIDTMEADFKRLMEISESVDIKLDQVTSSDDILQSIQAKIRDLQQSEEDVTQQFERLESKKHVIDVTTAGIDKNFASLQELEKAILTLENEIEPLPNELTTLESRLDTLAGSRQDADVAIEQLGKLDATVADIEERLEQAQTAREWLARTETRLTEINTQAQDQLKLMQSLISDSGSKEKGKSASAPANDVRNMVVRLSHEGWTIEQIAEATKVSRGEVELILELHGSK
jgi:chromosome segregation ATPase